MEDSRLIEDRLRAEYVRIDPVLRRTRLAIETEINYLLLPVTLELEKHEQILVRARVKDCESAIEALRRRQEGTTFDVRSDRYSLLALPDLVAIRILGFPEQRLDDARRILAPRIATWTADPIPATLAGERDIALKYHGQWRDTSTETEIQFVSLLIGLFWEVEHAAIYKPSPKLGGLARSIAMTNRTAAVHVALREFEEEFGRQIEALTRTHPSA